MMPAAAAQLRLPVRTWLGFGEGQVDLFTDHRGWAIKRRGLVGKEALHFRGDGAAMFLGYLKTAAGLRPNIRAAADGHERHRAGEILFHGGVGKAGPIAPNPVA